MGFLEGLAGGTSFANTAWNIGSQLINWKREDAYNQKMWERDDNAVQRHVADLKAAGLSPVLASGSGAGNSAPIVSQLKPVQGNPALDYLSALSGKADISHTNAQTALTNMNVGSEKLRQNLINNQTDYTRAMYENMSLQNAFYADDILSKINLRGAQGRKIEGEIAFNLANTALTKSRTALTDAQTTYQQVKTDHERTLADQAKIQRDMLNFDRMTQGIKLYNSTPSGLIGHVFGKAKVLNLFNASDLLQGNLPNVYKKNYWDYN